MSSTFPSLADAKAHIAKIRREMGFSEGNPANHNVLDLKNALTTLSEQLFQSSTRFLLELVQNADDNAYHHAVIPSVHFTYSKGFLRVDYNETGFSPRTVEDLCRVGQSTKEGGESASRNVGEKGIGFKSVFKAADIVWIKSGHYSFKFDKNQPLGMIAPIWDEFPAQVKEGWTSLYLQLSDNFDQSGFVNELRSLDSRLLIFLRRLRRMTVSINERFRKIWRNNFSREEIGKDLIRLVENEKSTDYIIKRSKVSDMPKESKREGITSSEIVLGFPINEDKQPRRESQKTYAFLPIRDYGFEFLIQADFILIASREDIDDSAAWNHKIRNALLPAFLEAIKDFNKGNLRYTWPRYLPTRDPVQSFLKPFHIHLRNVLPQYNVLCSQRECLVAPKELICVPEKYTFEGEPITMEPKTISAYLSEHYSKADLKYLETLGVIEMSESAFFAVLQYMLQTSMLEFKKKSEAWHSHLAEILISSAQAYHEQLLDMPLVPLDDGSWVSVRGKQIFFPTSRADFDLPGGLELLIVEAAAARNSARRKLYINLGVGDFKQELVLRHIEELHATNRANSNSIPQSALVSQIQFLHHAGWLNPRHENFWFCSESGQRFHGSQLYQDSKEPLSASFFFGSQRHKFRFIHADYMNAPSSSVRDSWSKWLEEEMDVATIPKLVQASDKGFKLSEDFDWIIKNFPSLDVLLLLRDHWKDYSQFLDSDEAKKNYTPLKERFGSDNIFSSVIELNQKLRSMHVTSNNGEKFRLDTTFLPSREMLLASQNGFPFLDIPDPSSSQWQVLQSLGFSIKVDVSFLLRCLQTLSEEKSNDKLQIEGLYDTLQLRFGNPSEASNICKSLRTGNSIYIPSPRKNQSHEWVPLAKCRWEGPPTGKPLQTFRTFKCLKNIYPGNRALFCSVLKVEDAQLEDLIEEVKSFETGDSLTNIASIYHMMEKYLEGDDDDKKAQAARCTLRNFGFHQYMKIYPVSKNWNIETDQVSRLENSTVGSEWFIADTVPFRTIFAGVVPLLDIKFDDLVPLNQLMTEMGLKKRYLSQQAQRIPRISGVVEFRKDLTDKFRSKLDFIIRLIPTTKDHRQGRLEIITQLQNLEVYSADEVIQEWCVTYKGSRIKGRPGNGQCALIPEKEVLKIYLAVKCSFETNDTPVELVDEIFNFCGMKADNPAHNGTCLHLALSQDNVAKISDAFADKGVPSLKGLNFTDSGEKIVEKEKRDVGDTGYIDDKVYVEELGETSRSNDGLKKTLRAIGTVPITVIALPIGAVVGLAHLFKSKKNFDGKDDDDDKLKHSNNSELKDFKIPKSDRTGSEKDEFQSSISRSLMRLQRICPSAFSIYIGFKGEFTVHRILSATLGQSYNPERHWLSPHRIRASFPPPPPFSRNPCFSFPDSTGTFTQLLQGSHHPSARKWIASPPTYHIDVKSCMGDMRSEFKVSEEEFERARKWSVTIQQMQGERENIPKDVYVLARLSELQTLLVSNKGKEKQKGGSDVKIIFLVDPWEWYHSGRLRLKHKGKMIGSII